MMEIGDNSVIFLGDPTSSGTDVWKVMCSATTKDCNPKTTTATDDSYDPASNTESASRQREGKRILHSFQPIYTMLKIFGLYSDLIAAYSRKETKIVTAKNLIHLMYCVVLELCFLLNASKHIYDLQLISDGGISSALTSSISNVLVNTSPVIYLPLSIYKLSGPPDGLINGLQIFVDETTTRFNVIRCRNAVLIFIFGLMGINVISISLGAVSMEMADTANSTRLMETFASFEMYGFVEVPRFVMLAWLIVRSVVNIGLSTGLTALCLLVAHLLIKCMKQLSENIDGRIPQGMDSNTLRKYRNSYEAFVELGGRYDSCVNYHIGTMYFFGSVVPCLMLYGIVHERLSEKDLDFSVSTIIYVGLNIILYMITSVILNAAMHRPRGSLYRMNTSSLSENGIQELSLFISRLSGSPIGVSVYGLFVIDTSTVLMLIGSLVTYAIVVLQFQPIQPTCP